MEPILYKRTDTGRGLCLCDLGFVVWKDEIEPPAMKIVLGSEVSVRYRCVFDMPPRSPFTPRAIPSRFAGFLSLP